MLAKLLSYSYSRVKLNLGSHDMTAAYISAVIHASREKNRHDTGIEQPNLAV